MNDNRNEVLGSNPEAAEAANKYRSQGVVVSNVMKDDFGLDIPIENVPIPSRGIIYPAESSIHNKETVQIRPMTAKEEDILTSRALIKNGTVLSELIRSCLLDKSINPEDLISGDRNAIMVALRITGYGADYEVEVECPACEEKAKQNFDLSELEIKRLDIDPVAIGANLFELMLPVTKKNVRVKFLTGCDEREIMITSERKRKSGFKTSSSITDRLTRSVMSVDNVSDRNKLNTFIRNLPVKDSHTIRTFLDSNEPGIDMKGWLECNSCHETTEVKLPMGASFFWPDTER